MKYIHVYIQRYKEFKEICKKEKISMIQKIKNEFSKYENDLNSLIILMFETDKKYKHSPKKAVFLDKYFLKEKENQIRSYLCEFPLDISKVQIVFKMLTRKDLKGLIARAMVESALNSQKESSNSD